MNIAVHFKCLRCGCEVIQYERAKLDDWLCMNCRFGRPSK